MPGQSSLGGPSKAALEHAARPGRQSSRWDEDASERTSQALPATNATARGGRAARNIRSRPGSGYLRSARGAVLGLGHASRVQGYQRGYIGLAFVQGDTPSNRVHCQRLLYATDTVPLGPTDTTTGKGRT